MEKNNINTKSKKSVKCRKCKNYMKFTSCKKTRKNFCYWKCLTCSPIDKNQNITNAPVYNAQDNIHELEDWLINYYLVENRKKERARTASYSQETSR